MIKYLFLILLVSCSLISFTQSTAVPFTLEDRDRIMRTEQEIKSLRNEINARFESMNTKFDTKFESQQRQIDDIKTMFKAQNSLLYWAFGIIITIVLFTLGYTIWDRRTALKPVQREQENLVKALREYSRKHTDLSEIFKKAGVL